MPEKTEIFLVGYYGFRNTGDELILGSILNDLRKALPAASFTVISHDPDETAASYGVRAIRWFDPQAIADATERAQLVVVGGGGLFHDTFGFAPNLLFTNQNSGLGLYAGAALYGALAQKRVMLWGVGVGPLVSDLARDYAKAACWAADVITVRDELSKTLLKSAGVPSSMITVTADGAFASPECMRRAGSVEKLATTGKRSDGGPTIGVALRHWDVGVSPPHWERQLGEALDKFTESKRGRLVFIPFQTLDTEKESDVAVAKRIASQLKSQADVTVLEERLTPAEIGEVIAGCDLVAGMRLHSVVLAVQAGVPVVALSYDSKVSALMERVGIPEFDISLRGVQSDALKELMIRALQQKRGISASLRAASEKLARKAARNVARACELLQRPVKRKSLPPELVPIVARAIQGQIAAAKQMDQRMQSPQAQVEELSARTAKQHADNEELISAVSENKSAVAKLREQLQGKDRFVLETVLSQLALVERQMQMALTREKQALPSDELKAAEVLRSRIAYGIKQYEDIWARTWDSLWPRFIPHCAASGCSAQAAICGLGISNRSRAKQTIGH